MMRCYARCCHAAADGVDVDIAQDVLRYALLLPLPPCAMPLRCH